ncbi:MAG TPA: hypothetical protein VJ890_18410 [Vineibacter sp.]|nr:hypothetical protein [Vineibacter sp.]
MVMWVVFWLSVALIPVSIWLHLAIPPFSWQRKGVVKTSRAWLFGLVVIALRFLLHAALMVRIAGHPLVAGLPAAAWTILSVLAFLAIEVALGLLHHVWIDRATGADRFERPSVRVLGPLYFAAMLAQSLALFLLLRAAG